MLIDRAIRLGVGFLVGVWVARYLGPEQFGQLAYALAFVGLFAFSVELALESIVVRELVRDSRRAGVIIGSAMALRYCGAVIGVAVACVLALIVRPGDWTSFWLVFAIACSFFTTPLWVAEFLFLAALDSKVAVIARLVAFAVTALVRILLILTNAPVLAFAWIAALEGLLGGVALVIAANRTRHGPNTWRIDWTTARALLQSALPLILASFAMLGAVRVDQLFVGNWLGDQRLGQYAAAVRLTEVLQFAALPIASSLLPALVMLRDTSAERFNHELERLFGVMLWLGFAVAATISLFAQPIVLLIYGPAYADAGDLLRVYVWTCGFSFVGAALAGYIVAEGQLFVATLRALYALIAAVVLCALLIPRWGAQGAAIAAIGVAAIAVYSVIAIPQARVAARALIRAWWVPGWLTR